MNVRFAGGEDSGRTTRQKAGGMVGAAGIEPATPGLEIRCSIRLSYAPLAKLEPFYCIPLAALFACERLVSRS